MPTPPPNNDAAQTDANRAVRDALGQWDARPNRLDPAVVLATYGLLLVVLALLLVVLWVVFVA
jgi:hypothetical protein